MDVTNDRATRIEHELGSSNDWSSPGLKPPSFILFNSQGLFSRTPPRKVPFLREAAEEKNAILIAITESWLTESIFDQEILREFPGFSVGRSDRIGRQNGGVAIYLRNDYNMEVKCRFSNGVCELLGLYIPQLKHHCFVIYRPPDTRFDEWQDLLSNLRRNIESVLLPATDITIMGDLNFPKIIIDWKISDDGNLIHHIGPPGNNAGDGQRIKEQASLFMNLMSEHNLLQYVGEPTRGREILDLMFTNNASLVHHVLSEPCPTYSDHNMVTITVNYKHATNLYEEVDRVQEHTHSSRFRKLDFRTADWNIVRRELAAVDWSDFSTLDPDQMLYSFYEKTLLTLERIIPVKRPTTRRKFWIPKRRKTKWRRLGKLKKKLLNTANVTTLQTVLEEISDIERWLEEDTRRSAEKEENDVVANMKTDVKCFFNFVKRRQHTMTKVGPFIDPTTNQINPDPLYTAEQLALQYNSVYSTPRANMVVHDANTFFSIADDPAQPTISDVIFTNNDIIQACKEMRSNSAAGPDGVPSVLLKNCAEQLSAPLLMLWKKSFEQSKIPSSLLAANISPIHKGGSRALPKQYRPVALTSHVVKVFERVLRRVIVGFLEQNSLMSPGQHGFRGRRSTLTQLLDHYDHLLDDLESGANVDVVYLDFSKAFDKVDHGILFHRLKEVGITGRVAMWLHAFLHNRTQVVCVEDVRSQQSTVISGVPQGTVLGPVMFLIHISGMEAGLDVDTRLTSFADDTRIIRRIKSDNDLIQLQTDLRTVYEWGEEKNMEFNGDKFEVMRYWPDKIQQIFQTGHFYEDPDRNPIAEKAHLRDLGVQSSDDLTFDGHICNILTVCTKMVGLILRCFRSRSPDVMNTAWKSIVQSRMDYCSQLWSPQKAELINRLEDIQRSFTSRIAGMDGLDYWERLHRLRWYSQQRRRERYAIILVWKVAESLVDGYSLTFLNTRRGRECNVQRINAGALRMVGRARSGSLACLGAKLFNMMPRELRDISCGPETFKKKLDNHLKMFPDQPTIAGRARAAQTNSLVHIIPMTEVQHQPVELNE